MNIVLIAGMIDKKLRSKISPFQNSDNIEKIYLVRRVSYNGEKIRCFSPPEIFSKIYILCEIYRALALVWILTTRKIRYVISAGFMPHAIYANTIGKIFFKKTILLLMGQVEIDLTFPPETLLKRFLIHLALKSDYIGVRGSSSLSKIALHGYDPSRIFIPHNVFDFQEDIKITYSEFEFDLVYIGNFHWEKRIDLLVEIYRIVKEKHKIPLKAILVGTGKKYNEIREMVRQYDLEDNITFYGYANEEELNQIILKSKVVGLTSELEGLPMTIIEAFNSGRPVIAFDVGDISDVLKDGENGFLIEFGNVEDYALKLVRLLSDQQTYSSLSKACIRFKKDYKNEYSVEEITKVWDRILERK